ncbi:hypothetical protein ACC754_40160, partial [Rhizobium johnstonii]
HEMMTGISRCRFFHFCPSGDHLDLPSNRIENTHVLASENKVEGAKAGSARNADARCRWQAHAADDQAA